MLGSIGALLACYLSAPLRHWARTVSLHALLAVHLVRFVGIYFLYLHGRGQLPFEFGVIGVGDIVVAATSIAVAWINRQPSHSARRILRIWNIAGLFDIALVVMIAGRYLHLAPEAIVPLRSLPLVLLPLYFVPLIIASHFLISIRPFWLPRTATAAKGFDPKRDQGFYEFAKRVTLSRARIRSAQMAVTARAGSTNTDPTTSRISILPTPRIS